VRAHARMLAANRCAVRALYRTVERPWPLWNGPGPWEISHPIEQHLERSE